MRILRADSEALPRPIPLALAPTLLIACGLLASGCISFRGASAVGSFGQLVGNRASAVSSLPTFCSAENIFAGAQPTCPLDKVERYAQRMVLYSQSVAQYATMMRNLAEFNDPRPPDALTQLLTGLSHTDDIALAHEDPQEDEIAAAAGKLTSIGSQPWRRDKLESLVVSTHPHLMALIDGLLERITLLSQSMRDMATDGLAQRQAMLAEVDSTPAGAPGVQGVPSDFAGRLQRQTDRVALLQFQLFSRQSYDALVSYQKALLAFKRAHTILFEYASRPNHGLSSDTEIYNLLLKDIPPILR